MSNHIRPFPFYFVYNTLKRKVWAIVTLAPRDRVSDRRPQTILLGIHGRFILLFIFFLSPPPRVLRNTFLQTVESIEACYSPSPSSHPRRLRDRPRETLTHTNLEGELLKQAPASRIGVYNFSSLSSCRFFFQTNLSKLRDWTEKSITCCCGKVNH